MLAILREQRSAVHGRGTQGFFNPQELIVLRYPGKTKVTVGKSG